MGNRTTYTVTLGSTTVTTYTYDAANRLTSAGGVAYTWDARGNLTNDGTFTYTYDAAGRLVGAQSVTSTLVYTYNADGLRVAQQVSGTLTTFAWDLALPLAQVLATGDGARDLYGLGRIAEVQGSTWAYVLPDALGSARQWADGGRVVAYAAGYAPYGEPLWQEGNTANAWGFTGEWQDPSLGMLYLRARWYEPEAGRFTQRDPWGGDAWQPGAGNEYNYADGNPVNQVDPTGLYSMREIKEVFHAQLYDPDVLRMFGPDYPLEGRWGWLEVLRVAEDGDRLVVFDKVGCSTSPSQPEVLGLDVGRVIGVFRKTDSGLFIGDVYHVQAAWEGDDYQIQRVTHCAQDGYWEICDPVVQHWVRKTDVNAEYRYMGLRCDFAAADLIEGGVSLISLLLPLVGTEDMKDVWELMKLAALVANTGSKKDAVATSNQLLAGADMLYLKFLAKYGTSAHPAVAAIVAVVDAASDLKSLVESGGCAWLP